MLREDKGLAFMLRYENIAWYEDGAVKILDRRVYPAQVKFVICKNHREVAQAITDMVTQSAGPYLAAGMGMALAGWECKDMPKQDMWNYLESAAVTLSEARPTTSMRMREITGRCLRVAEEAMEHGTAVDEAVFLHTIEEINRKYAKLRLAASRLVPLIPNGGTVLTQCFGEAIVGLMLEEAKRKAKDMKVICAETRPYFQGARLTAAVVKEQGFDVTVITDNMPAYVMSEGMVDVFTSAADAISMDGYVVNKVGTFQIAVLCKYFGVPYFTTGFPDRGHADIQSVKIELRNPEQVLEAMGVRTAVPGVKGFYPAFDKTPPHLISGIVTDRGIFSPYNLADYYADVQI